MMPPGMQPMSYIQPMSYMQPMQSMQSMESMEGDGDNTNEENPAPVNRVYPYPVCLFCDNNL